MKINATTKAGFTLVETMTVMVIFSLLIAGTLAFFVNIIGQAKAGSSQLDYLSMSFSARQTITSYIRMGKAIGVETNSINIWQMHGDLSKIEYVDSDDNPLTTSDNMIIYDPNVWLFGDEVMICKFVRPVDGEDKVFTILPQSPSAVRVEFHLGDSIDPNDASSLASGRGYQGVDVVFAVAPRNLQYWYK